ncbi:MAG: hypothetical protein GX800_13070 [Clostridiaceae bacterium]|jgi:hypothetical protein|nr:hypothetical protein [Clostridiaceae bacterium]
MREPKCKGFRHRKAIIFNVNKIYLNILIIVLSALMLSQFVLTFPNARAVFTNTERFESLYKNADDSTSSLAELTLLLTGTEPTSDIEFMQNGQPIAVFYDRKITVTVSDNSVLEIDGTRVKDPFSVQIIEMSSNIDAESISSSVNVNSNISFVGRIFIK